MQEKITYPLFLALKAYNLTVEIHHHAAYQLVFSNDQPFQSTLDGRVYENIHGFLIKPQVPHYCVSEGGTLSIFNIEPYSNIGIELAKRFPPHQDHLIFKTALEMDSFFELDPALADTQAVANSLLAMAPRPTQDKRVAVIVEYIHSHYQDAGISSRTLAKEVFLSPSRLTSLFKHQMGSSLSKYLLWTRLRQAIYRALTDKGASLTTIAHDAGFYDLPQMNKYMYEMFGMPPKAVKYSSDLIQVY